MNWIYPKPSTHEITVSVEHIDKLNHTNNACYVVWCEKAAWLHSQTLGLTIVHYHALDKAMVLHKAEYQYFQPSFLDQTLVIGTWLTHCDQKLRLERQFQIVNSDTGDTLMRGKWSLVCMTLSTGKASRLPPEFIEAYSKAIIQFPND